MCDCNRPPTDKPAQPALYAETAARFTLVALGAVTLANGLAPKVLAKIPAYESWLPFVPPFIYLAAGVILAVILKASLTATCVFPMAQLSDREVAGIFSGKDEAARTRIIGQRAAMAGRLAKALTFKTISWEPSPLDAKVASELKIHQEAPPASDNATDYAEFDKLHAFLKASFPQAFAKLDVHYVNKYSLVMVWKGSEPKQQPYMLAAHLDVVPTPDLHNWKEDPFAGTIKDGFVWGRGAIDDKHSALGWLETIEDLLKSGFKPKRSIYFAFGHDEEVGGFQGAAHIAKWIAQNVGPRDCFEFILDEGLFIIDGAVPGHKKPIAFVCVAEKGYLSVELTVTCEPGHSSTPPAETAIGILSKAVKRIEDSPLPAHFNGPARSMFSGLREYAGALKYIVFNLWLFGPVLSWVLQRKSQTNSIVRTTTALTQFNAGVKDNVIPSSARAIINHRIHPFDTIESVIAWDTAAVADVRVKIRPYSVPVPPAPVSDSEHAAFFDIRSAVHRVHGGEPRAVSTRGDLASCRQRSYPVVLPIPSLISLSRPLSLPLPSSFPPSLSLAQAQSQ